MSSKFRNGPAALVKWVGVSAIIVIASGSIGIAVLPSSFWKGLIERSVTQKTGRVAVIAGGVELHLFSWNPRLVVEQFTLANADWAAKKPMVSVGRLDVTLHAASLFHGELTFPTVIIESPGADFERESSGRTNWDFAPSTPGSEGSGRPLHVPVISHLVVSKGELSVVDQVRKLKFDGTLAIDEKSGTEHAAALNLRGSGTLNDKPFHVKISGPPLVDVDHSHPYSFDAAVAAADIKLDARVEVLHPFDLAHVRAGFRLSAQNLADVYYLTGLALPNTRAYQLSGTLERDNLLFKLDDLQGKIGSSDIQGKLSVDTTGNRPSLTANLTSRELDLADLAAPLGARPAKPPQSNTTLRPITTADSRTLLLPDADLQVERVRGMDADVMFDAASVITAKLPLRKVHFHLGLENGKLMLSPLTFELPQGQFSGSVSIDARDPVPQTDLDMRLTNVDLAQFKPKDSSASPLTGQLLGRIRLHGTGASVHKAASTAVGNVTLVVPKGEMREVIAELTGINLSKGIGLFLAKSEATTEVRCGVANFRALAGDLVATAFTIDTTEVLITGRGHLDLKSEDLDMSLRGQPKEARLLRLRTPILVRGTLSHPKVGIDAGKALGQAGGAAALGVLLTPLAAVLAFVDGGLAKDANCAALLRPPEKDKDVHPPAASTNRPYWTPIG